MGASRGSPLLVLLLLVWTLGTCVHCQTASVSTVSTEYVEIVWKRQLQWMGVSEFTVYFTSTNSRDCNVIIPCSSPTCLFSSTTCGLVFPCTETNTTIIGGNYTAPSLVTVTGPEPVTNFNLRLEEGVEYISWVNPSRDSSYCHNETAVRVSFNDEISISYLEPDKENTSKSLCVVGRGAVDVWTIGGDGKSNSSWGPIIYNGSSVVDILQFHTCQPVGCDGIEVTWSYVPVCSDVSYFEVTLDSQVWTADINCTKLSVTGLRTDYEYRACVRALREDGKVLDTACDSYCSTADEVVENLSVKAFTSRSLNVSWDPPICLIEPDIKYRVGEYYESNSFTTSGTSGQLTDLQEFTEYDVKVQPIHDNDYGTSTTKTAYTLLPTPSMSLYVNQDYISVSWYQGYDFNDHGFIIYSKVTWGRQLEHEALTQANSYTIKDFNSTYEVDKVCVAEFPDGREDLMSPTSCRNVEDETVNDADSGSTGLEIAMWALVSLLVVMIAVVVGVILVRKSRQQRQRQQEEQEQQQQHSYGNETGLVNLDAT